MRLDKKSMLLYVITDRTWIGERTLQDQVEEALKGGATFIQLREKELSLDEFLNQAKEIKRLTDKYNIPFVINDNVDVAIKSDADGVHIGQGDMNARDVRNLIGNDKILGVSANTVETAILAEENGADYIGVGAVFNTSTKGDAQVVSMDIVKEICDSVSIPVVAIGGINEMTVLKLKGNGLDGICVISAVFSKDDIYEATKSLFNLAEKVI